MSRAEMRRAAKAAKKKTVTYNLTQEQLDAIVAKKVNEYIDREFARIRENVMNDAVVAAVEATYVIPMEILMDEYWPKSYKRRLPGLYKKVVARFNDWQDGKYDIHRGKQRLWDNAGVGMEGK